MPIARKKTKKILPDATVVDLGLYLEKEQCLVISDIHLGIEEALEKKGVLTPRFNYTDCIARLQRIFSTLKEKKQFLKTIVITGDLKHEFGRISTQEWGEIIDFIRFLKQHAPEVILLKGNHDAVLEPVAQWEKTPVKREHYFPKSNVIIIHGDIIPLSETFEKAGTILMGHEHPAIALKEGAKLERYKCFLKGKWNQKTLVVLPSFHSFSEGTDIRESELLSPFLAEKMGEFEIWAIADQAYYFGKLKHLRF